MTLALARAAVTTVRDKNNAAVRNSQRLRRVTVANRSIANEQPERFRLHLAPARQHVLQPREAGRPLDLKVNHARIRTTDCLGNKQWKQKESSRDEELAREKRRHALNAEWRCAYLDMERFVLHRCAGLLDDLVADKFAVRATRGALQGTHRAASERAANVRWWRLTIERVRGAEVELRMMGRQVAWSDWPNFASANPPIESRDILSHQTA